MSDTGKASDGASAANCSEDFPAANNMRWRFADLSFWNAEKLCAYAERKGVSEEAAKARAEFGRLCAPFAHPQDAAFIKVENGVALVEKGGDFFEISPLSENFCKNFDEPSAYTALIAANARGIELDIKPDARGAICVFSGWFKGGVESFSMRVKAAENSDVKILLADAVYGSTFLLKGMRFDLAEGAKLSVCALGTADENSPKFERADVEISAGADFRFAGVEAGGAPTRCEMKLSLNGENANALYSKLLNCGGNTRHNLRTRQLHNAGSASSKVDIKAILKDLSGADFVGEVLVGRGAQKSKAYQSCRALQLSDEARLQASPILEIEANDVECSHGCAAAGPDEDELFYMRARGLNQQNARKLLVEGFAQGLLAQMEDAAFAEFALMALNSR